MKIRTQQFLLVFIPILVMLLIFSGVIYFFQHRSFKKQIFQHVESISEATSRRVKGMVTSAYDMVSIPANNLNIIDNLLEYSLDSNYIISENVNPILKKYTEVNSKFKKIHIVSMSNKIIASSETRMVGKKPSDIEGVDTARKGKNYLDGFHFDEHGTLCMYLAAPLRYEKNIIGVLLIEHTTEDLLSISSDYTGLGSTGETVIGKSIRGKIYFLVPLRFDKNAALNRFLPPEDSTYPLNMVLNGEEGIFEARDYRGKNIIASGRFIPESKWGLVTKIDTDEALQPVYFLRKILVLFLVFSIIIAAFISLFAGQFFSRPLHKLISSAIEIKNGDLSKRVDIKSKNEIGELALAFNQMADQLAGKISRSQKFSEEILNATLSGIIVLRTVKDEKYNVVDFEYIMTNRAAEKLVGKTGEELKGRRVLEMFPFVKKLGLFDSDVEVVKTGNPLIREFLTDASDRKQWVESNVIKFDDGLIVTLNDISARKEGELRLIESEAILRQAQELSRVGSFVWEVMSDKLVWSDNLYRILGYEPGEYSVSVDTFYNLIHPEDRAQLSVLFDKYWLATHQDFDYECRFLKKDNSVLYTVGRAKLIIENDHDLIKVLGVLHDITKVKQTEMELLAAQVQLKAQNIHLETRVKQRTGELSEAYEKLKKINAELEKFAYVVSHDLKAPLNAFEGLLDLLKQYKSKPLEKEGFELVILMEDRVQVMKGLISNILASTKREKKVKEPVSLYGLVKEIISILNPPSHIHILVQQDLPTVHFNRIAMTQILQNLIGNAIKYLDKPWGLIRISYLDEGNQYKICVDDNGKGIPENRLDKIFKPFEIAHNDEKIESHGIGLSIVKQLVEEYRGTVLVESTLGVGSSFRFTVPKDL